MFNLKKTFWAVILILVVSSVIPSVRVQASNLSIQPIGGAYAVGSTFDVSVFIDTQNQTINAISLDMSFPTDKLQVVSPTAGNSIIGIYTTPPTFDNRSGRISIVGGITNGINTNAGLVAKISFRVMAPGTANLRILSSSQTLLNDGRGTDALNDIRSAIYTLQYDSANGPLVSFDESFVTGGWYNDTVLTVGWDPIESARGYSYILSNSESDIPDDIIDSTDNLIVYRNIESGTYYFHVKALAGLNWGPTSHTLINIDNTPPQPFAIEVHPGIITSDQTPQLHFKTTDEHSGIDRYEIKIVDINNPNSNQQVFFVVTGEDYTPEKLEYGQYDVIVRAYDKAGNVQESVQRIVVSDSPFRIFSDRGFFLYGNSILPWYLVFKFSILALLGLLFLSWKVRRRYLLMSEIINNDVMTPELKHKLSELEKYREKYGKIISVVLLTIAMSMPINNILAHVANYAPPAILSYSESVNPNELIYVSGRAQPSTTEVIVHLQNQHEGQVYEFTTPASDNGDWFYQHTEPLPSGKYSIWTTARDGVQLSPPSPQVEVEVRSVAFQYGDTQISFQNIYIVLILILLLLIIAAGIFIIYHLIYHQKRHRRLVSELDKSEQAIAHGFIQLRHDLAAELELIKSQNHGGLTGELAVRVEQIKEDISNLEKLVSDEIDTAEKDS